MRGVRRLDDFRRVWIMYRNRVWLLGAILGLAILMLTGPASAWEFNMKGSFNWEYEYITQLGRSGFFGPYDVDANAAGLGNSLNGWLGAQANDITVSGSDGAWNTQYMELWPEIRFNPAVRVRGLYRIGQWWTGAVTSPSGTTGVLDSAAGPELVRSEYINYGMPGKDRSFSPGYWNLLWLTAQVPWGELAIGKRPSSWGCGMAWDGDNRTSESFSIAAPYGPFRISLGFYPARQGYEGYYNDYYDKSGLRYFDMVAPNITYRNGPLDTGIIVNIGPTRHRGPERLGGGSTAPSATNKAIAETRDREDYYGGAYVKYNNGRFFFNSEFDFYTRRDKIRDRDYFTVANANIGFVNRYVQDYRVMAELGAICGPAKVSLLYAWSSGNDRRRGIRDNINQGTIVDPFNDVATPAPAGITPRWTATSLGNTSVFRPYSYLMVYNYGLGAYINADNGKGYFADASAFGGRLDYAVAANLNLYSSFFWADRVGNGYGWGFLVPNSTGTGVFPISGSGVANNTFGNVQQQYKGTFNAAGVGIPLTVSPNIPDNNLGWEIDAGFDWKLLEGVTVNATFGYWQPGKWFNFACVSRTNPGWNAPTNVNGWGIQPNRNIDAIYGMEMKLVGDF
jgi:hypothetical protein